jgi:SNF2 family DNA or RNA helicase
MAGGKFDILVTTYEFLMNKHDRPRLSKIKWAHLIIDEGHRIKNANCKLNTDLKQYSAKNRLLLTGTPIQVSSQHQADSFVTGRHRATQSRLLKMEMEKY